MFGCDFGPGFFGEWSTWMIIPMIFRLIVLIGIIYVGIKVFKSHSYSDNSAMNILDEKYAMGEINEEEYLRRKNTIYK